MEEQVSDIPEEDIFNYIPFMSGKTCSHCLPDCVSTLYSQSVSATPLRRCDTKNIGLTMLCKFDGDVPLPAIWSHQVISEYRKTYGDNELPEFLR